MDRSLRGLMMINRNFLNRTNVPEVLIDPVVIPIPEVQAPQEPPIIIPPIIPSIEYQLSDFGENAINNHFSNDAGHSERVQFIFNYVTRAFRERCTSYQSYANTLLGNTLISAANVLHYSKLVKSDIIFTPYVGAAQWMEHEYYDFVLPVSSHYDNDSSGNTQIGGDNNRHDITSGPGVILPHSVAVSSRRDTPSEFKNSTSEGFGMEFFENVSSEGLDGDFPDKDVDTAFAELLSTDGINLTSTMHPNFSDSLEVGEEITIRFSDNDYQNTFVTEIIDGGHIVVSPEISSISNPSIYGWHKTTLGGYMYGQAESWAIPIVAGKLKVIKMTTGADWDTVRDAARVTAKRNPTGIPEIDNTNWDIYRGFGCIQMQAAIEYINNL